MYALLQFKYKLLKIIKAFCRIAHDGTFHLANHRSVLAQKNNNNSNTTIATNINKQNVQNVLKSWISNALLEHQ